MEVRRYGSQTVLDLLFLNLCFRSANNTGQTSMLHVYKMEYFEYIRFVVSEKLLLPLQFADSLLLWPVKPN